MPSINGPRQCRFKKSSISDAAAATMFGKLSTVDCKDDVLCYPARFLPFLPAHLASILRISRYSFMISSAIRIVSSNSGSEGVMLYPSDRKIVVEGKSEAVRVALGTRRIRHTKTMQTQAVTQI